MLRNKIEARTFLLSTKLQSNNKKAPATLLFNCVIRTKLQELKGGQENDSEIRKGNEQQLKNR